MNDAMARMAYPKAGHSKTLGLMSFPAMTMAMVYTWAFDDQGRGSGHPTDVQSALRALFPAPGDPSIKGRKVKTWTMAEITELVDEIVATGFWLRYEVDGEPVLQSTGWWSHQHRMPFPKPSTYPPPEGWIDHCHYKTKGTNAFTDVNWPIDAEAAPPQVPSQLPLPPRKPTILKVKPWDEGKDEEFDKFYEFLAGFVPVAKQSRESAWGIWQDLSPLWSLDTILFQTKTCRDWYNEKGRDGWKANCSPVGRLRNWFWKDSKPNPRIKQDRVTHTDDEYELVDRFGG